MGWQLLAGQIGGEQTHPSEMQLDSQVFASCVKLRACYISEDLKNTRFHRQGSPMEAVAVSAFVSAS